MYTVPPWVTGTYVFAIVGANVEAAAIVTGSYVSAVCGAVEVFQDDRLWVWVTIGVLGCSAPSFSFVFIARGGTSDSQMIVPDEQCSAHELSRSYN